MMQDCRRLSLHGDCRMYPCYVNEIHQTYQEPGHWAHQRVDGKCDRQIGMYAEMPLYS